VSGQLAREIARPGQSVVRGDAVLRGLLKPAEGGDQLLGAREQRSGVGLKIGQQLVRIQDEA